MLKNLIKTVVITSFIIFISSCSLKKDQLNDPKQRLKDYISASFNLNTEADRKNLESFLIGEARSRLAAWSDEQFRKAFVESKRQFVKLNFREVKEVSPHEVHIVYELTYLDQSRGTDAKVTNKKLCQLIHEKSTWFIREVRNIKELVEYQNEMSLP